MQCELYILHVRIRPTGLNKFGLHYWYWCVCWHHICLLLCYCSSACIFGYAIAWIKDSPLISKSGNNTCIKLLAQREEARQQSAILETYHEKEEEARTKYDDFEQVAYNPKLPITNVMAQTIQASDIGPEVAYYLGANPKEADRISRLAPFVQAKEIGRIEAKLATDPPVKRTTSAPAPISPVTARSSGGPAYDTTDPRSTKTMTDSQWIEAERARQMKKLQAQMTR